MVRDDNFTRLSSDRGPIADARRYPVPADGRRRCHRRAPLRTLLRRLRGDDVTSRSYPFPDELAALPRDRAAVIEASAGTGKTYLIEHLVVDRLVRGDARIDEMLVVTFTERAAAELVRGIRALVRACSMRATT